VARKRHTIKGKVSVEKEVQLQEKERKIEVLQEKFDAENDKTTKLSEQERTIKALNDTALSVQAQVTILQHEYNDNIPVCDNDKPNKYLYRTLDQLSTGKGK
jgi:hypothetical protein